MDISYDISQTGSGKAGCGYYAHAIILAILELYPEYRYGLHPNFGDFYYDPRMPKRNPYSSGSANYGPLHSSRESACLFWNSENLESLLGHPDLIHSNNFWCPTQLRTSKLIYTFYDMGFIVDPSWTTEANRIGCFEGVFRSSIKADWVVAISESSKKHYLDTFPHFPKERIRVIYPCSRFTDSKLLGKRPKSVSEHISGRFWLNVGTIEPRKNQRMLVEAYARYISMSREIMPLIIAGGNGWLMDDFQKLLIDLGVNNHVHLIGYVSDEELVWLYRNCYANLYPTLFEGFGLPVLEGMQFSAATIASNSTSIPEVTGNAAVLLDPLDVQGWANTMLTLADNNYHRCELSRAASLQSQKFDWNLSASQLIELYRTAAEEPKR